MKQRMKPLLKMCWVNYQRVDVRWQAIELCFLLNVDSNFVQLVTTLLLSQQTSVGLSTGTPNILNLHLRALRCSMHVFIAKNSLENALDSTVAVLLEHQMMGAFWTNRM